MFERPRILVVNDDHASLLALTSLLDMWAEELNYTVVSARSGHEALRQVLRHDFAVILLDVNMPDMNGFETAEAIQQHPRWRKSPSSSSPPTRPMKSHACRPTSAAPPTSCSRR